PRLGQNGSGYRQTAPSRRSPSCAYSTSRSLNDTPRCSARAAIRSASRVGRTTVRRTQSSLSQTSSSDTLSPLPGQVRRVLWRDVAAQDAVAQQAQAAQVG